MLSKKHKIKYGLKLWSTDRELFPEAVQSFKKGTIDFIELYIVPNSFMPGKLDFLNDLKNIPTIIHAPHTKHNFDVFSLNDSKIKIFKEQVAKTADFLNSKFIIVHAGIGDSQAIFKENIEKIKDKRILIENMTKIGINDQPCFGHSYEQLKFIKERGFNFCLDFSHAIKSSISQKIGYKEFVEKLIIELTPNYFHICNGRFNNDEDEHMDLFDGDFDIKWIKEILLKLAGKKDVYLVFETPKSGNRISNDIKNINYFLSI